MVDAAGNAVSAASFLPLNMLLRVLPKNIPASQDLPKDTSPHCCPENLSRNSGLLLQVRVRLRVHRPFTLRMLRPRRSSRLPPPLKIQPHRILARMNLPCTIRPRTNRLLANSPWTTNRLRNPRRVIRKGTVLRHGTFAPGNLPSAKIFRRVLRPTARPHPAAGASNRFPVNLSPSGRRIRIFRLSRSITRPSRTLCVSRLYLRSCLRERKWIQCPPSTPT